MAVSNLEKGRVVLQDCSDDPLVLLRGKSSGLPPPPLTLLLLHQSRPGLHTAHWPPAYISLM